jgi:hypothetical protein
MTATHSEDRGGSSWQSCETTLHHTLWMLVDNPDQSQCHFVLIHTIRDNPSIAIFIGWNGFKRDIAKLWQF